SGPWERACARKAFATKVAPTGQGICGKAGLPRIESGVDSHSIFQAVTPRSGPWERACARKAFATKVAPTGQGICGKAGLPRIESGVEMTGCSPRLNARPYERRGRAHSGDTGSRA